ncbi:MAG: YciC family protein [Solirubrobacterales bacterium]
MRVRGGERSQRLRLAPLVRDILGAYRRHWRLLVPLALLVLLPQSLADAFLDGLEIERVSSASDVAKLASIPLLAAVNLAGEALYAGIVTAAVLHWRRGERLPGVRPVAREIPVARLIALDLILAITVGIGFALLVIPGLVIYAYLAISPALIELRKLGLADAIAASARLVHGNFLRVLGLILAVFVVTDAATTILESPLHGVGGELALNVVVDATLEPFQGLATAMLALALIDLHPDRVA